MAISTKRVYEKPAPGDGTRILVDRLWPRGVSKAEAKVDVWMKDVAPSNELRRWYSHELEKWPEFKRRYFAELRGRPDAVRELLGHAAAGDIVLLYGSKETTYNNATALKQYLGRRLA
jgi:uncharacterized protein YeaO (DUF488 family)